jgi:hypothetical protein
MVKCAQFSSTHGWFFFADSNEIWLKFDQKWLLNLFNCAVSNGQMEGRLEEFYRALFCMRFENRDIYETKERKNLVALSEFRFSENVYLYSFVSEPRHSLNKTAIRYDLR